MPEGDATAASSDETETEEKGDSEVDEGDPEEEDEVFETLLSLIKLQRTQHVKGARNLSERPAATDLPATGQTRRSIRLATTPPTVHTH